MQPSWILIAKLCLVETSLDLHLVTVLVVARVMIPGNPGNNSEGSGMTEEHAPFHPVLAFPPSINNDVNTQCMP